MIHKKQSFILLFIFVTMIILIAATLFELSRSRTYQVFGEFIPRIETSEKIVALTFDDGPNQYTDEILKILQDKDIQATFYLIGQELEKNPEIGKKIIEQNHDIGNHSYSHTRFYLKSQNFIDQEITKTNQLIRQTGFTGEITFRPPNGKKLFGLPWYLEQNNIKTILWDVEPDTYLDNSLDKDSAVNFLVDYTVQNTRPGSIILLHPHCQNTCEIDRIALPKIIDALHQQGYQFVTISKLLSYQDLSKN